MTSNPVPLIFAFRMTFRMKFKTWDFRGDFKEDFEGYFKESSRGFLRET